jgi:hypothetical protein
MTKEPGKPHSIHIANLPEHYPTNFHIAEFWEHLGRAIATYGVLEEVLGKAIFAYTGTRQYTPEEAETAYDKWLPKLEKALTDSLGGLIKAYETAVREYSSPPPPDFSTLVTDLAAAADFRNVLCHASWRPPADDGKSLPLFVNRKKDLFRTPLGVEELKATQQHVAKLICDVINSVTRLGWQFPGSGGPGTPIWSSDK